jgi:hypothetical protein
VQSTSAQHQQQQADTLHAPIQPLSAAAGPLTSGQSFDLPIRTAPWVKLVPAAHVLYKHPDSNEGVKMDSSKDGRSQEVREVDERLEELATVKEDDDEDEDKVEDEGGKSGI